MVNGKRLSSLVNAKELLRISQYVIWHWPNATVRLQFSRSSLNITNAWMRAARLKSTSWSARKKKTAVMLYREQHRMVGQISFFFMKCRPVPSTSSLLCACVLPNTFSCCFRRKCVWSGSRQLKSPLTGKLSPSCLADFKNGSANASSSQ